MTRPAQGWSLVVHAPAKLNLTLRVLGRRTDGFHAIETVMVSLGLYDTLLLREVSQPQVLLDCHHGGAASVVDRQITSGRENLVVRAAETLRTRCGVEHGIAISLLKRIPAQAGLGGGSSDAAATIVALNRLWKLSLSSAAMHKFAAELGSDVNFFVDSPRAAICRGRGEQVEAVPLPRLHIVLVCPPSGLSTADVFDEWSSTSSSAGNEQYESALPRLMQQGGGFGGDGRRVWNDLEAPARRLSGDVDATLRALRRMSPGPVGMSGSGTSCFALCRTARQARRLAGRLRCALNGRVYALDSRS